MAFPNSVITKSVSFNHTVVDSVKYIEGTSVNNGETYKCDRIEMYVRPYKNMSCRCPKCMEKRPIYDHKSKTPVSWRATPINGVPVFLLYSPARISCPEHGVLTEYIPWQDGNSRFTESFNNDVAFLALTVPKTVCAQYMGIDWKTVGNSVKSSHDRLEPDVTVRLRGLKRFCVDETSYRKGHKYITVVYDLDKNQVAWVHEGYGKEVFTKFCLSLTPEEREAVEVVAGDGARWIDECTSEFFVHARRCADFFHVVSWANDALDRVKNRARRQAERDVDQMKKNLHAEKEERRKSILETEKKLSEVRSELDSLPRRGRPSNRRRELEKYIKELEVQLEELREAPHATVKVSKEEYLAAKEELESMPKKGRHSRCKAELLTIIKIYEQTNGMTDGGIDLSAAHKKILDDLQKKADQLKDTKYALGMNPENLSSKMRDKLSLLEAGHPDVFLAYQLKEQLGSILHMKNLDLATLELDKWLEKTKECDIPEFVKLGEKITRHRQNILNAVELQVNSSRSEATNTTIKSLIAVARGFRNLDNLFSLVYLRCSDIVVPLNNRYQPSAEKQKELREIANQRRKAREEAKRGTILA